MHTGPIEIPPGVPSPPQLPVPRQSNTPRGIPTASYASSQHSGKSPKKEVVHLPCTSAHPNFADLPGGHGGKGGLFRPDTSYAPRYQGRNRLRGFSMAAYYGGADFHILPALRNTQRSHQMLPQISVVPATKHTRAQQRRRAAGESTPLSPQPVVVKRVEVSLHEVQQRTKTKGVTPAPSPQEDLENLPLPPRVELDKNSNNAPKGNLNIALKSVDLNKGLNIASSIKKRARENMKSRVSSLEQTLATKGDEHVMTLSHLPLKEVYLKPDTASTKEQAFKQQHDKTIRILKWLRDLKYLDEKAVQRGRSEVERTQFQLPEIKETVLMAYL